MMVTLEEEKETKVAAEEGKMVAVGKCLGAVAGQGQGCVEPEEGGHGEHADEDDCGDASAYDEAAEAEKEGVKWAKHYSSGQQILLVGEGDFSFSLSLATSFRSASNIVATSLDSYSEVTRKYDKAESNLRHLKKMGAKLLHGIDVREMKLHTDLKMRKFDRIIFNFPHAGFKGKEDDMRLINLHKKLVRGFFRNASRMLRQDGEVHISHKTSFPFTQWNLEQLASMNSLVLLKCVNFKIEDYPGYNNKRGDGPRSDQPFPLGECCTFIFRIGKPLRRKPSATNVANLCGMLSSAALPRSGLNYVSTASDDYLLVDTQRPHNLVPSHYGMLSSAGLPERSPNYLPISPDGYPFYRAEWPHGCVPNIYGMFPSAHFAERNLNCVPTGSDGHLLGTERLPLAGYMRYINGWPFTTEGFQPRSLHGRPHHLDHVTHLKERAGSSSMTICGLRGVCPQNASIGPEFITSVEGSLRRRFEVYMNESPGRTMHGYINELQGLHRLSVLRAEWLRKMLLLRQDP